MKKSSTWKRCISIKYLLMLLLTIENRRAKNCFFVAGKKFHLFNFLISHVRIIWTANWNKIKIIAIIRFPMCHKMLRRKCNWKVKVIYFWLSMIFNKSLFKAHNRNDWLVLVSKNRFIVKCLRMKTKSNKKNKKFGLSIHC